MDNQNEKTSDKPYATVTIYLWGKPYEVPAVHDEFEDEDEPTITESVNSTVSKSVSRFTKLRKIVQARRVHKRARALGYDLNFTEHERLIILVPHDRSKGFLVAERHELESLLDTLAEKGEIDPKFLPC